MKILSATISDLEKLTEITKKSKAHWGYSDAQMEEWSDDLTISKEYIEKTEVYHLIVENEIIAYYSYFKEDSETIKLDNLFILPDFIGKGFGKILMLDFLNRCKNVGVKKVILHSDPHAEGFYAYFGFVTIGQLNTSMKDRYLPIMELII